MTRIEQITFLNQILLEEMPQYRGLAGQFPKEAAAQRRLLRSLMNLRPPMKLNPAFLSVQDALLSAEREEKGVVDAGRLPVTKEPRISLWKGDITKLSAGAVVNAGNHALLGCFYPCHGCIDNAIHSAAGLQLREECNRLMQAQDHAEPAGRAKITPAFNLPSGYVLHTVGPVAGGERPSRADCALLESCYRSCMALAREYGLKSIAFCCISTGEFHFPNREAAEIAVATVKKELDEDSGGRKVIFNVFKETDERIYRELLGEDRPAETRN